jgi:pSer/pThr/pTyr-binding forkhead associated (FHA) protein
VPQPAQRFLEYVFLALLYLFFLRVVRAVWVELKEPRVVPATAGTTDPAKAPAAAPKPTPKGTGKGRGTPQRLVVVDPDQSRGATYPLGDEITIGRAAGCAVPLTSDNFVSQVHARIFRRGKEYRVEDLGSTNGTMVNGRRMNGAVPLRRGDHLQVGRSVLELQK